MQATGFQQAREVGVSAHYRVAMHKGGSLMVAEEKNIVPRSWMRLGCSRKWLSVRLVRHM